MRLVVDASTLVAEVLRARGRKLLSHSELDLLTPEQTWSETTHELETRLKQMVRYGHIEARTARGLLEEALEVIEARITLVYSEVYHDRMEEALRRVPRDPNDAPLVALALMLGCGIWTNDRDLFGCGLPVWTTETLIRHLDE